MVVLPLWKLCCSVLPEQDLTMKATAVDSGADMRFRGISNSLAPAGMSDAEGAGVPHWYSTYVSTSCLLRTA